MHSRKCLLLSLQRGHSLQTPLGSRSRPLATIVNKKVTTATVNARSLFSDCESDRNRYQMDYEAFRSCVGGVDQNGNPFLRVAEPDFMQQNVKSVQGWRGGAERGFLAIYPDIIQTLCKEGEEKWMNKELGTGYLKVLTQNLSPKRAGNRRFGLLVPITYKQLMKQATNDEMDKAHVLGWCVELLRSSNSLTNEIMGLKSKNSEVGIQAFNDALLLQNGAFILLANHFKDDPNYVHFLNSVLDSTRSGTVGRLLQMENHPLRAGGFQGYTYQTYREMIKHNVSNTSYLLPISLALHLAGLNDEKLQKLARNIFEEMGYISQVNRDYARHYLENSYSDISEGRLTWLVVLARQRLNKDDIEKMDLAYGRDEADSIRQVVSLFEQVNLKQAMVHHLEEKRSEVIQRIQQISKVDKMGLSQEFLFNLIDSMDVNKIP